MAMTVVVTRNSPSRVRGFLASCMCEIAPGVYTAPRMTPGVRDRVWGVLESWFDGSPEEGILMTWPDSKRSGGQAVRTLGWPQQDLWEHNGVFLSRKGQVSSTGEALPTTPVDWARSLMGRDDWCIIDTETTGLSKSEAVIEIAIIGNDGRTLFESLIQPDKKMSSGAARVHGIDTASLRSAPKFPEIYQDLREAVHDKIVVAYHAAFDRQALHGVCSRHGFPELTANWQCAMERYQQWRALRPTLAQACEREGIQVGNTHRASADARLVWDLVQVMAKASS